MELDKGPPAPVRKRSGSSGRRRPRSSDGEAAGKKPRRGGLAAAIQKYITVRPTDPLIQEILPKVEASARPAAGTGADTVEQSGSAADSASVKPQHAQQHKAPMLPLATPQKQERPVLPIVGRLDATDTSLGGTCKLAGRVAAQGNAAKPAVKVQAAAAKVQPARASQAGSAQPARPTSAEVARVSAAATAALSSAVVRATVAVTSPSGKAGKPAQRQAEPCSMVASPPPAPPPPPSTAGGGLARRSSESSTRIKLSLQQPVRRDSGAESLSTNGGDWPGEGSHVQKGRHPQRTAAQQGQRSGPRRSRPAAETFVLQASRPAGGSRNEPNSEGAAGAVQLVARLFEPTVPGASPPAQQQHQQQHQQQRPLLLPVPVAVLPPGLSGLPLPLPLQLLPLQQALQSPQAALPTLQRQQQQQQQRVGAPAVDPQLTQQALRALDETPQALMLGPASAAALGSSPMLTPLALMLMDQGSSQPAPAATLQPGLAAVGSWAPGLAAAGAMGGAVDTAGAAAFTPCTALLSALLPDGLPAVDVEAAKLEEMLQRGDFSIESLLGSLPATPALATAAAGPAAGALPIGTANKFQTSTEALDPAPVGGSGRAAALAFPAPADGPPAAETGLSPLLALPLVTAGTAVFMRPQLLAGAAWAGAPQPQASGAAQRAQQPVPASPSAGLQRTPVANLLGARDALRSGLTVAALGSPSQGLMSPSAVAEWLA